nr:MAG TPA: hypothetical protein [Caudoviricetes sp.]
MKRARLICSTKKDSMSLIGFLMREKKCVVNRRSLS